MTKIDLPCTVLGRNPDCVGESGLQFSGGAGIVRRARHHASPMGSGRNGGNRLTGGGGVMAELAVGDHSCVSTVGISDLGQRGKITVKPYIVKFGLAFFVAAIGLVADDATAQTVQFDPGFGRNELFLRKFDVAVSERPQPQFDPVPIYNQGSFLFLETAAVAELTDNVFATKDDRVSDLVMQANVNARFVTDWRRHRVNAYASGTLRRYAETTTENSELFGVGAAGILEIDEKGGSLQAGGQVRRLQVSRTNTESPFSSLLPIFYTQANAFVGATYGGQQLHFSAVGAYERQRFDTGNDVSQTDEFRDRDIYSVKGVAEYAVVPAVSAKIAVEGQRRDFIRNGVLGDRDSDSIEITAGANFEMAVLMRARVDVGYISRSFKNPNFVDVNGLIYDARLEYFPTRLVTITAAARRSVSESSRIGVGAFIADTYSMKVDWEYLRNVIVTSQFYTGHDSFQGLDLDYDRIGGSVGVRYRYSRAIEFNGLASVEQRSADGTVDAREFFLSVVKFSLAYKF
jgi:hypothetical protein